MNRSKSNSVSSSGGAISTSAESVSKMAATKGDGVCEKSSKSSTTMKIIGTAVECTDVVSNQLWICPMCNKPDESVPMIGCDSCDDWYHW